MAATVHTRQKTIIVGGLNILWLGEKCPLPANKEETILQNEAWYLQWRQVEGPP